MPSADHTGPYPTAERTGPVELLHGETVADPYRWLEDPHDARTRVWSVAQDALFASSRDSWPGREHVVDTLGALLGSGSVGPPVHRRTARGAVTFFSRREPHGQHGVVLVREPGPDGPAGSADRERVLVDPMVLDPSGATTLDSWSVSREGDLLAYQVSEGGREESVLRVLDVATGEDVDGPIDRARYSPVAWLPRAADGSTRFYYVRRLAPELVPAGEQQYHRRVRLHTVPPRGAEVGRGPGPDDDPEVFGRGLATTNYYGAWTSQDGRWLVLSASAGTAPRNDVWLADLHAGGLESPTLVPVAVGLDAQHSVWVGRDGRLYAHTDLAAPRGRLCVADPAAPEVANWRDLLAEEQDSVLEDVAVLDAPSLAEPLLLVTRTRHTVSELATHRLLDGAPLGEVPLPGLGSLGGLVTAPEERDCAWVTYTDHSTPPRVLRVDGATGIASVWALPPGEAPAGPDVTAQQLTYRSTDGTEVRMFIVARADSLGAAGRPTAPAPTVLYGYGGFGISLGPGYSAATLAWVRAGGVWAVANLRGGSEEGEAWHRAGMREHKQNVFDDFHTAADTLVAGGWTTREQLAISGGSNGGLLVGAALTQRPAGCAAVLCSAPLLDMVRYEQHGLGATWNDEYGSAADPTEFRWLLGYSPYHQVRPGTAYPAVLFTVFDGDTRVDPLHARKLAAALQHATSSDPGRSPVLLRREADVGHGARSLDRTIELSADGLLFLAAHTGLRWGS